MAKFGFGPGGLQVNGVPINGNGIPATPGDVFFVNYGTGDDGVGKKSNSISRPFQTIAKAYSLCTTNKDDVIVLIGNSTHVLTSMLDVSKNRIHFVGLDGTLRRYGQNAKVQLGVTTAATDIGTIQNTGVRNSFSNIKFINSNTVAQGIYCFVEAGEYSVLEFCEFYKDTDLDQTGAAELVMNGDSAQVRNCTVGSLVNAISGAILRPCVLLTGGIVSGKKCRDVTFEDCLFWRKAGNAANCHFYAANATDVERMLWIKNSAFINAKLAGAAPDECVKLNAAQTEGQVLIDNCTSINNTKLSTSSGALIAGPVPTYATAGIAVAS